VTREAVGAPEEAAFTPVAPMAPAPFVPDGSAPLKLITVIEETTLWDNVDVTVMLLSNEDENARQISEVPLCTFSLATNIQVKPPPATDLTVVFVPDE
jgi:hypothetical protein